MAVKDFVLGFTISAALESHFKTAFSGASTNIMSLNKKLKECRDINGSVTEAFKKHTITAESYSNMLRRLGSVYPALEEKQKSLLATQARLNSAQQGMVRHWTNFMQIGQVWGWIKGASDSAVRFESAMADVRKVVDFDNTGQFKDMEKTILAMSTRIPMAADGLAQIVAAGGQSGIARDELTAFAESAAKMGVAFDITADQAGEMMAKWRTAFRMNQGQVVALADQINYLGNNTAASAPKISEVVTRIGPLGEVGGVASNEIAALSASMVGAGVEADVAATGIKNMILALVSGESATDRQQAVFAELGLNAEAVARGMQENAKGTIIGIMEAMQGVDKARQGSLMQDLFGKESLSPISTLLTSLDNVKRNFALVGDSAKYAGSMQSEYDERSKTTANSLQLLQNRQEAAKIQLTSGLLPVIVPVAEKLGEFAVKVGEIASKYPGATTVIGAGVAVTAGAGMAFSFLGGSIEGAKFAYHSLKFVVDAYTNAEKLKTAQLYLSTARTKMATVAQWAWNAALNANPIGLAIVAGMAFAGVLKYLYDHCTELRIAWDNWWTGMQASYPTITSILEGIFKFLLAPYNLICKIVDKFSELAGLKSSENPTTNIGELKAFRSNASGGIYSRGAFLTTFAEDSGESAIPHTPTARNIGLLARTNEIMGSPLGGNSYSIPISITVNGSADTATAQNIGAQVEAAVRRALDNIANQKARVSYA